MTNSAAAPGEPVLAPEPSSDCPEPLPKKPRLASPPAPRSPSDPDAEPPSPAASAGYDLRPQAAAPRGEGREPEGEWDRSATASFEEEGATFRVGDWAEVNAPAGYQTTINASRPCSETANRVWVCRVEGVKQRGEASWFLARWLWHPSETLATHGTREYFHPREYLLSDLEDREENTFQALDQATVKGPCQVRYFRAPSGPEFEEWVSRPHSYFYRLAYNSDVYCFSDPAGEREQRLPTRPARVMDLFSGCGGLSQGFAEAGIPTSWAVEYDAHASATFRENHAGDAVVFNARAELLLQQLEWDVEEIEVISIRSDSPTGSNDDDDDDDSSDATYSVEEVLAIESSELPGGCPRMLLKWVGYRSPSWEPLSSLHCDDLLGRFAKSLEPEQVTEVTTVDDRIVLEIDFGEHGKHRVRLTDLPARFLRKVIRFPSLRRFFPCKGDVSVIIGGPPCQGCSKMNHFREEEDPLSDPRNMMMQVFLRYVAFFEPELVLFENVPGIFDLQDGLLIRMVVSELLHLGYQLRVSLLRAECYGAPQRRTRTILWAARSGVRLPRWPAFTHNTQRKAIFGVARHYNDLGIMPDPSEVPNLSDPVTLWDALSEYQRHMRVGVSGREVTHHWAKERRDYKFTSVAYHNLDVELNPDGSLPSTAHDPCQKKRVWRMDHLCWREPAFTLLATPDNVVLHPSRPRLLTVREYARLQGFPDRWVFHGGLLSQYRQTGNAVPVALARALASTVFE
eukprot:m51a1_g1083 putative dna (cytosine-5)-methyltransferase (739) ;mRNA; f:25680-28710